MNPDLRLVLTPGDPGGIGPELLAKSLDSSQGPLWSELRASPVVCAPYDLFSPRQHEQFLDGIEWVHPQEWPMSMTVRPGMIAADHGRAALAALKTAHDLVSHRRDCVLVTAPLAKESIYRAGMTLPGHTEILAQWSGLEPTRDVRMMLRTPQLKVVLHTIHIPLRQVPERVTIPLLLETFSRISEFLKTYPGFGSRIAVCGLNPHAGEGGHLGREEVEEIAPALAEAQVLFPQLVWVGPLSADTLFARALQGDFDLVVAMYHDQGLIPVKTLDMHHGVNLTMGLPYIRTSPDHGTAFNLAGKNQADPTSFQSAMRVAAELFRSRPVGL